MNTVKVKYVGLKPFSIDNVAHSGKAWNGNGDVQEVTPEQAKVLVGYPDQWELEDADDAKLLDQPVIIEIEDKQGDTIQVDAASIKHKHLEKMNATELAAYAKQKYNKTLARNKGRKVLLDEVLALEGGATHV